MVKFWVALVFAPPPLSDRETVTLATPLAFNAGVKLRTPVDEMVGPDWKRAGLSVLTLKVSVWPDSSAGPALMPVAQAALNGVSSFETTFGPAVNEGVSLTAV